MLEAPEVVIIARDIVEGRVRARRALARTVIRKAARAEITRHLELRFTQKCHVSTRAWRRGQRRRRGWRTRSACPTPSAGLACPPTPPSDVSHHHPLAASARFLATSPSQRAWRCRGAWRSPARIHLNRTLARAGYPARCASCAQAARPTSAGTACASLVAASMLPFHGFVGRLRCTTGVHSADRARRFATRRCSSSTAISTCTRSFCRPTSIATGRSRAPH